MMGCFCSTVCLHHSDFFRRHRRVIMGNTRKMYHEPHIFVNDEPLKATDSFTYLGSTLSREANIDVEVNNRPSIANSAFGRLRKKVWDQRGISQETKLEAYMAVVLTVLLYMHVSHGMCTAVTPENSTTSIQNVCGLF